MDPFQTWIVQELHTRGWSRSDFAERMGVSQPIVSKWLSRQRVGEGRHMPADERLRRMADLFGVPVEDVRWRAAHPDQPYPAAAPTQRMDVLVRAVCLAAAAYTSSDEDVLKVAERYASWVIGQGASASQPNRKTRSVTAD